MEKDITLGTSANISYIAKKGQAIKTGDPLLVFENSFDDDSIADVLDKVGEEFGQSIEEMSNKTVKSKYTGTVVDVRIYRNHDTEDFSQSIQKIIKQYESKAEKKEKVIDKLVDPAEQAIYNSNIPQLGKIDADKVRGHDLDGILIEFYVEYEDKMGIGDKLN